MYAQSRWLCDRLQSCSKPQWVLSSQSVAQLSRSVDTPPLEPTSAISSIVMPFATADEAAQALGNSSGHFVYNSSSKRRKPKPKAMAMASCSNI